MIEGKSQRGGKMELGENLLKSSEPDGAVRLLEGEARVDVPFAPLTVKGKDCDRSGAMRMAEPLDDRVE